MSTNYHYVMSPFSNVSGKAILLYILAIDLTIYSIDLTVTIIKSDSIIYATNKQ